MLKRRVGLVVLLALSLPAFSVMAQEPTPTMAPLELPPVDPLIVFGDISIAGSSTVYPLTEAVAALFQDEGYVGEITIDSIGSGAGIDRFCAGETDIANASRAIELDEIDACAANGRTPIEFRVGTDALAVVVSSDNDFARALTDRQLFEIFSGAAATWADVNPDWPAEPIQLFSPGSDSGTFDYFVEAIFEGAGGLEGGETAAALLNAPNIQLSEDDNVLVQGVAGSPYAIGYFGYAYFRANENRLRVVSVNGVAPTAESMESGDYPLARPLFMYSDAGIIAEKPQVGEFISFYLSRVNEVIETVGYFPASVEVLTISKARLLQATGLGDQLPADIIELLEAEANGGR